MGTHLGVTGAWESLPVRVSACWWNLPCAPTAMLATPKPDSCATGPVERDPNWVTPVEHHPNGSGTANKLQERQEGAGASAAREQ